MPTVANIGTAIKHPEPDGVNLSFVSFDITCNYSTAGLAQDAS